MPKFLRSNQLIVMFLFLGMSHVFAQYNVDSLKTIIAIPKLHDTTRLANIALLIDNLYENEEANKYTNLMGKIAQKNLLQKDLSPILHKKYTMYLAAYYNNVSIQLEENGDARSLDFLNKSIKLYESVKANDEIYSSIVSKGLLLSRRKRYKEAVDCYYKALKYFELNEAENADGISYVYSNLGVLYGEQGQNKTSINFIKKAIVYIDKKLEKPTVEDELQKATYYYNIGSKYILLKDYTEATKNLNVALQLATKHNQNSYRSFALGKLGVIDLHFKKIDEAETKLVTANAISESPQSKALTHIYLGEVYLEKGAYPKAVQSIKAGLAISKEINNNNLKEIGYHLLYKIYKRTGNFKESIAMLELFNAIKDSSKTEEVKNELKQQQLKYDYERKELKYKLETERKNASKNILLLILLSAVILLLIGAYFLYRNYKQKQAISIFEKNELNQKLLLTQMNPHFIFNSIDNIQSLIYNKQEKEAVNYLTKFSKLTRQILENSNESYVSLSEELAMIDNYLAIQQLLYNNKFNFSIVVDEGIDPESIVVPPMLTQPFIENAIKHGLKNKTDNGFITIRFYWQEKQLIFEVCDNGIGFNDGEKTTGNKSLAMKITKERLANISKKNDFQIHIQNLFDDDKHVVGAKVYFDIPYLYEN